MKLPNHFRFGINKSELSTSFAISLAAVFVYSKAGLWDALLTVVISGS